MLSALSLSTPEALVHKLGANRLLEALLVEVNSHLHSFITNMDRMALAR